ncbi:hypothetical protein I7I48_08747 [Histoplasma ohiense]|nr:hypothetical protein I7I48_08747 [Histoplasma ohiense (nom. inval.)]
MLNFGIRSLGAGPPWIFPTRVSDRQQPLLLKDELLDKFVFCQTEPTSTGFKICLDQRMTPSMVS